MNGFNGVLYMQYLGQMVGTGELLICILYPLLFGIMMMASFDAISKAHSYKTD